jgi:hypothetical protein
VHLLLDAASGLLLAVSPWLFGFADRVFWPHLVIGLVEIGAALTTRTIPDTIRAPSSVGSLGERPQPATRDQ